MFVRLHRTSQQYGTPEDIILNSNYIISFRPNKGGSLVYFEGVDTIRSYAVSETVEDILDILYKENPEIEKRTPKQIEIKREVGFKC